MSPLCHERIPLSKYSDTYCMRAKGHSGPHSQQLDTPHPTLPKSIFTMTPIVPPLKAK